jgi:3-methyladenine DNA glycosylase/8-oxoguanine DNA glycosylase
MPEYVIKTDKNFSFHSTLYSHGWSDLLPFKIDSEKKKLNYSFELSLSQFADIEIHSNAENDIIINSNIGAKFKDTLVSKTKRIFRLDEDITEFYKIAKQHRNFFWIIEKGAGRMLRCASLWEDMVKMLCTTNCTWRLTQIMTENLYNILGNSAAFPTANFIAETDEQFLREKVKMGYRAPYLLRFARDVAIGKLNLELLENWQEDSTSLYKEIRKIKGFGDYAVSSLMKLIGRYDFMGFDSWNRKQFYNTHKSGKHCSDEQITKFYKKYGKWAGLFFWLDVTKEWYFRENPWS